jgi:filamentous hemagglutinin family protein
MMKSKPRALRRSLLVGASVGSLMIAGVAAGQAARLFAGRGGSADPAAAAIRAAQTQATRAAQTSTASTRAIQAMRRAADTRAAMSAAQAAARAAAQAAQSNIPNGLGTGGLQVAQGVATDPSLWLGAKAPVQAASEGGRTAVSVEQTQSKAILTWDSFNVGRETDLSFRQNGADWVALNRVTDVNADPSRILGTIKAIGSVYILNRNGVIFGGASQVNVRNLVAASAALSDDQFLNRGIYSPLSGANYLPAFTNAGGKISVEAGARITTNTPTSVTAGGGFALLIGTDVHNAGSISTPKGQTLLAAGDDFIVRRGVGTAENPYSTTRGNEVRGLIGEGSASGAVTNSGVIEAGEGDVTLAGRIIRQDGIALATTSVNQRGTVHLLNSATDLLGSVTLGADSLTTVLPDLDSDATALDGQRAALVTASGNANLNRPGSTIGGFDDRSLLADRIDQGRVEIVTGGDVTFAGGSQTVAQGGQVAVQASAGRITVADGARIDVSGTIGVALDMASNSIRVNIQGNELRDSPANREGTGLKSQNVWVDVRDLVLLPSGTGGYEGDRWYTPGGLLEVGGYLANTAHGIGEWTAVGGTVTLAAKEVVARKGASIDLSGGSLDYAGGYVRSSLLMGADGRLYDIRNAPAFMNFVAVGNAFRREHDRWGAQYTQTYANPLFARDTTTRWEDGYTVGRDAGRLILSAPTAIMEADVVAAVVSGDRQTNARPAGVTDGYIVPQDTRAQAGALVVGAYDGTPDHDSPHAIDVKVGTVADVTGALATGDALPEDRVGTVWLDAARLNGIGLGGLTLETAGAIAITSDLTLADGGALTLIAPTIDLAANVTARSGSIRATNFFESHVSDVVGALLDADGASSITVRQGVTLDLRGLWVNTALNAGDTGKLGLLDGGSLYLASTHDVTMEKGSRVDVSSGAAQLALGQTRGGVGGDVSLIADLEVTDVAANGLLTLDGTIAASGVTGGGMLKIESGTAVSIGGELLANDGVLAPGETSPVDIVLAKDVAVNVGDRLPIDYSYTVSVVGPGEQVPKAGINGVFTVAADWKMPLFGESYNLTINRINIPGYGQTSGVVQVNAENGVTLRYFDPSRGLVEADIDYIPAGSSLFAFNEKVFGGYTVDPIVFPNGLPVTPYQKVAPADSPSPAALTVAAGTVVPAGLTFDSPIAFKPNARLDAALFQSGFSKYDITARTGVVVTAGTAIDVTTPVYRFTRAAASTATGAAPAAALELWTPPVYLEDPSSGVMGQRAGADITLRSARFVSSSTPVTAGGPLVVAQGASITVDPGHAIDLLGYDMTIDGRLTASGGAITLGTPGAYAQTNLGNPYPNLIWIGEQAVLDVAARPALAVDRLGRSYGRITDGGTIAIGGAIDWQDDGEAQAPSAFVVIRPGALLDASGTSGTVDVAGAGPVGVASDGGTIVVKSNNGLYLDGTMRAAAGGAGAAGGTLGLALETAAYPVATTQGDVLGLREFVIAQQQGDSLLSDDVTASTVRSGLKTGTARLGVDGLTAGGFGNLSLLVGGSLSFDGDVSLALGQSLQLYASTFGLSDAAAEDANVSLSAPYVRLAGVTRIGGDTYVLPRLDWADSISSDISRQATAATFRVDAGLIDVRDTVGFGVSGPDPLSADRFDRRGFATVDLSSTGDLRFLRGLFPAGRMVANATRLESSGDIVLTAAQLYPETRARAQVVAGFQGQFAPFVEGVSLTIRRHGDGAVAMPYSVFGQLTLSSPTVNQGGIVRAPLGSVTVGTLFGTSDSVTLLPGSITSTSAAGLSMPFGGTVDGITFRYDDAAMAIGSAGAGTVTLSAAHVAVSDGATVDVSGGGDLTSAGFVSGRGGSVDVLTTPFANVNPAFGFSDAGNGVYAIVPSSRASQAPLQGENGFGDPLIGQQITLPAGVPGLPAGTYTLLPSNYALQKGAFRIEIGAGDQTGLRGVSATGNGSYVAAGTLGIARTAIREALPNQVLITPAATVRTHSSYNETSYDALILANATRLGVPRQSISPDAGMLRIDLSAALEDDDRPALTFDGRALLTPANGNGFGGTVNVTGLGEIRAPGQAATTGIVGASVDAAMLSALNAPRLLLNAQMDRLSGQVGRYVDIVSSGDLVVRSGATITAGEIVLGSSRKQDPLTGMRVDGSLVIEEGASIIAKTVAARAYDSTDGYVFRSEGALIVSSGTVNLLLADPLFPEYATTGGNIAIGACVTDACDRPTTLVSQGTIAIATNRALTIADNVDYGAKNLVLGVASVNLGETAAITAAGTEGRLPPGIVLNQATLAGLLAGNATGGVPKLESLTLNINDSVNVFGSVDLDASALDRLVFGTPAIYGYGAEGDVATIRVGEFIWTGAEGTPASPIASYLGAGRLAIEANSILFGYAPNTQPADGVLDERIALGFAGVDLKARDRIAASGKSTLSVYRTRGDYVTGKGWTYGGGDLGVSTPLLTGMAGSTFAVTAGGVVSITAPGGVAGTATSDALGATLAIAGRSVSLDSSIVLPSGIVTLTAADDVTLGGNARIDVSGRTVTLFDTARYSWGGDVTLTSTSGGVSTAAGSSIDLSARNSRGGTLGVVALGDGGAVDLAGGIVGAASGQYDAGGTMVPFDAAELTVRARTLADFAGLNTRLNAGEVFGARRFQIKQGDLVVGDEVKAREVRIVLDGGDLTVNGTIDAAGYQVGAITLAASGDLTINGTLDAHGTGLRLDSYGKVIDSPNRAIVDLTSSAGTLTLGAGAVIDLRAGTGVQGTAVSPLGTLDLNAARRGEDDVAVAVAGRPDVRGARTVAVNAFRRYDDAPLADLADVTGERPQLITQAYLDAIDIDSSAFIDAALGNVALSGRLAGLGTYHLRPGVEVVSNAALNPAGNLTVSGDLDLSGYRYGPDADRDVAALRGFGEPGVMVIRAAGNLDVHGSINDGFAPPPVTPDDAGWLLTEGVAAANGVIVPGGFGGDIVVPGDGVVLDVGTRFRAGATLNYDVPVGAMTLASGTVVPIDVTLTQGYGLAAGTVVAANIYNADGSIAYATGAVLGESVALEPGMKLGAGTLLRADVAIDGVVWPRGVALPVEMATTAPVTLARGALIPARTHVELPGDAPVDLRALTDGRQGANWAVAEMLGAGAKSWDLALVAGADLPSADVRALDPTSKGTIRLADTHYVYSYKKEFADGKWYWSDSNYYGFPAGTLVDPEWLDPSYNICEVEPGQCVMQGGVKYLWAEGNYYGYPAGTVIDPEWLDPSYNICEIEPFQCQVTGGETITVRDVPSGPAFSILRTGTGDLSLTAAGDIRMESLYGVYTAGTAASAAAGYDLPRGALKDGSVLGDQPVDYSAAAAAYHAWYPEQGGNLTLSAGGDLVGDIVDAGYAPGSGQDFATNMSTAWLWRQGSGSAAVDTAIPTSWWINFGTYARGDEGYTDAGTTAPGVPLLTGFTGFGTLGGGDVTVRVGGDAGKITYRGGVDRTNANPAARSQGLVIAVGSTGRVGADGSLVLTGGGDIDMRIAGALNPLTESAMNLSRTALGGSIVNLRGETRVAAASIGDITGLYRLFDIPDLVDPRGADPFARTSVDTYSGIRLVPGDSAIYLQTLRDMAVTGAGDPTMGLQFNTSAFSAAGTDYAGGGNSWFSLWTPHTAIDLMSAGGDMTPSKAGVGNVGDGSGNWPSILRVAALGGNIYYGAAASGSLGSPSSRDSLAPSASGELSILASGSIYASGTDETFGREPARHSIDVSANGTRQTTMFDPGFAGLAGEIGTDVVSNVSVDGGAAYVFGTGQFRQYYWNGVFNRFAFGPDTAALATPRAADAAPIRFYAGSGDIVGLSTGQRTTYTDGSGISLDIAGAPLWMLAGRDIVASGTGTAPNFIVHSTVTDVSVISAGRDILYMNTLIGGPGTIEVSAGRNILQEDKGAFTSVGPIAVGDTRPGAAIALMAGMTGVDWGAIRALYLDPANLAETPRPLAEQPGKVARTYDADLTKWLAGRYGFAGTAGEALTYFDALPPEQQRIFLRQVYYAELRAGGREYNDETSGRFGSYLRGRQMIGTLFPDADAAGTAITRTGDIIMFGGSGVRTNFGGDIEMMAPGGQIVIGVQGNVPPASAGVITQGAGDISLFSERSILLGLSRIMTTFGGSILGWSEQGDINAGRGAKTTVVFTPPRRTYDDLGNVTLAPQVPSTGAGIATLDPIPEVAPGDIDLIAPLGTIDAGEAGIRVSGDINLAALQVLNAANIQVKGTAAGIPQVPVVNTGALTAASGAAASAAAQAAQLAERTRPQVFRELPSIITSRLLGFGQ